MHNYQIEDDIRTRKILLLVFCSIVAAYYLNTILQYLPKPIPWWVEYPSVLGFYGILSWLFDNFIWKFGVLQKWDWLLIPNLNGTWQADVKTCYDNFEKSISCKLYIQQTGSKILISVETDTSISHSVHATILRSTKLNKFELMYNFINEPKADSKNTMNIHYGTTWLQISTDCKVLDGEYFTGRGRQTYGSIIAKRQKSRKR